MADFKLIPCKKCKGAAELKEGYKAGYYVECKKRLLLYTGSTQQINGSPLLEY